MIDSDGIDAASVAVDPFALAGRGWHLFQVDHPDARVCQGRMDGHDPATCDERGKHPVGRWTDKASTDPQVIAAWSSGRAVNVGIACGPSGLVVIDQDRPNGLRDYAKDIGEELPYTYEVRTHDGRSHLYFRAPEDIEIGNATALAEPAGCDVRGKGGYVVGPGSKHASGQVYTPVDPDAPVAVMPDWLVKILTAPKPVAPSVNGHAAWGLGTVEVIRGPRDGEPGERHNVIASYSSRLRERAIPDSEARILVRALWERCEQPPACKYPMTAEAAEALRVDIYGRYPVGPSDRGRQVNAERLARQLASQRNGKTTLGQAFADGQRAEELAAQGVVDLPTAAGTPAAGHEVDPDEVFWNARDELGVIRDWARSRIVAPWAVLGTVIVRLLTLVPPNVRLPAIVGVAASLNTFVGLVGPSGVGKDAAAGVAAEAVLFPGQDSIYVITPGSGQGIAHQFRERFQVTEDSKKVWAEDWIRRAVLFDVSEVDTLTAMAKASGSTLTAEMRKVWSGHRLGSAYVEKTKAVTVPAQEYRANMLINIQPGRAAPLLDEADGGTPQRLLWLPATDPYAPEYGQPEPSPLSLDIDRGMVKLSKPLAIPREVAEEIKRAQREVLRGRDRSLEASLVGHLRLSRLKVSVALAILNQRLLPTMDDWLLAGTVIDKSESTRREVMAELDRSDEAGAQRRGELRAVEMDATDARRARSQDQREQRVRRWLLKWLREHPGATRSGIHQGANSADRDVVLAILDQLIEDGLIAVVDGHHKII